MLSTKQNVKETLLRGPPELRKTFLFEAAVYWAEEGHQVLYIAATPLKKLPAPCHDRNSLSCTTLKFMRFMYLSDYKSLVKLLVELHTFSTLPSVLLIDDLDHYLEYETAKQKQPSEEDWKMRIARTCAIIFDTANCCSRILNNVVHVCVWSSILLKNDIDISMFFRNIWDVTQEEDETAILLRKVEDRTHSSVTSSFKYQKFQDGSRILTEIFQ